jgi:hypothetical protein
MVEPPCDAGLCALLMVLLYDIMPYKSTGKYKKIEKILKKKPAVVAGVFY